MLLALAGCSGPGTDTAPPQIRLVAADEHAAAAHVDVIGLSRADLEALRVRPFDRAAWDALLTVTVASTSGTNGTLPVAGTHSIDGGGVRFTPAFHFDSGRLYDVRFDPRQLGRSSPGNWRAAPIAARVSLPKYDAAPSARVLEVSPTGATVPENLLRMYVQFSEPMGLAGGLPHLRLTDADGREVVDAFVPLDQPLWNADRTRYTLLFDPGRLKRGILPNARMGRPLRAGRTYILEVDAAWRDAQGRPLAQPFRRTLEVGPEILKPLAPSGWRVTSPGSGSRDPLVVRFPWQLDHALLERVLGVETTEGASLPGETAVTDHETTWTFAPRDPWRAGAYRLVALTVLEDPSGNRIGRAFEIDPPAIALPAPERVTRAFTVN